MPTLCVRKRMRTDARLGCSAGPGRTQSLRETLSFSWEEASNTILHFFVFLSARNTAWCGISSGHFHLHCSGQVPPLRSLSLRIRLDGAIVTHPHADHLDGMERLFRELLPHQYQDSVKSESPDKRLMCNGPVLLTKKFAQKGEAYRSLSEFLLKTKFEINLDRDDIQNAFGNDILFSFPSSPGVLYQRHKPSEDDEPFSEEKQRSKLEGGTEDDDLNKSSIILYTDKGGKICLSGDAYGYDITSMLRSHGVKNLDIFKLPHHGSPHNSILGKVLPPSWAFQNLASMVLLSISLMLKTTFDKNPEEENDIDDFRQQLKGIAEGENGPEQVQQVAEAFLVELKARLKNTPEKITPEMLLSQIQEKHIEIVTVLQQQSGQVTHARIWSL
ncbi:hypothetical protein OS493_009696 [Desmophyllum pertusum]|uniref:Metallo-beta-lactamase domain-containing protein n=1 Tax=Desmophyllum pertusum TaxID=174260 RepID=A0A9W9YR60_9CNID|nr:hypothetical protein OS493_009696 [Desmophyllum pertusum]